MRMKRGLEDEEEEEEMAPFQVLIEVSKSTLGVGFKLRRIKTNEKKKHKEANRWFSESVASGGLRKNIFQTRKKGKALQKTNRTDKSCDTYCSSCSTKKIRVCLNIHY